MKFALVILLSSVAGFMLFRSLVREVRSGNLKARDGHVYTKRKANPMLYWSSIILHSFMALFVFGIFVLAVWGATH